MKKIILIITIVSFIATTVSGKTFRRVLTIAQNSVPETEAIDNEKMEFVYDYRCCVDTTASLEDNYVSDNMLLQIATNGISKFSSYRNLTVDSIIMRSTDEQIYKDASEGKLKNGEFMTIFKNFPSGKLTHTEKICMDWFRYEEDMPMLEWEMTDSIVSVLGYQCHSAKCRFRGKEWTAFYAEDIPISEGPWKLHGLPGLIMKASDENGYYDFECIGIKSNADRPITMYKVPYNKVNRKEYYDTKHRYEINPYAYFETCTGKHVTVTDENGNLCLDSYDPIELQYDFIERDWRK